MGNLLSFFQNPRLELLERMPNGSRCAEVGVWKGDFSKKILRHTSPERLHLIDPWVFQPAFPFRKFGGKKAKEQADMDAIFKKVKKRFRNNPEVVIHRESSHEALAGFDDDHLDWVYLDGNHAFDYIMEDLRLGFAKVRPGGFVTGDDYTWGRKCGFPVEMAVRRFVEERSLEDQIEILDSQYIIQKPAGP